jgi:hypothetical protein
MNKLLGRIWEFSNPPLLCLPAFAVGTEKTAKRFAPGRDDTFVWGEAEMRIDSLRSFVPGCHSHDERRLPTPHAAYIYVHKVGLRVIANSSTAHR